MQIRNLCLGVVTMLALILGLGVVAPGVASATHGNTNVTMTGHVDCIVGEAVALNWRTDHGEQGSADLSEWTKVTRAFKSLKWTGIIKIKSYKIELHKVPKDGTTLHYDLTCRLLGDATYSKSFGVRQPLKGIAGTRHICAEPTGDLRKPCVV